MRSIYQKLKVANTLKTIISLTNLYPFLIDTYYLVATDQLVYVSLNYLYLNKGNIKVSIYKLFINEKQLEYFVIVLCYLYYIYGERERRVHQRSIKHIQEMLILQGHMTITGIKRLILFNNFTFYPYYPLIDLYSIIDSHMTQ